MDAMTDRAAAAMVGKLRGVKRLGALARVLAETPEQREAYDALLGGLRRSAAFDSGNSVLVTSALPNEGKTTVAACLAIAASLAGHSALLIDGNLQQPWLAPAAGPAGAAGLSDVLAGTSEAAAAIHVVDLFADPAKACPVNVMTAGARSSSLATVNWSKARARFQLASGSFDIVLFDAPSILAASEALLLAQIAAGVLLVVRAGGTDRENLRRATEQLRRTGAPIVGAALNQYGPEPRDRPGEPAP